MLILLIIDYALISYQKIILLILEIIEINEFENLEYIDISE